MGSGGSKKNLEPEDKWRERRPSVHELTNPPPQSIELVLCGICNRSFAKDRIERHMDVCAKTKKNDRQEFDMKEKRLIGTEAANYKDVEYTSSSTKKDWKKTHDEIIKNIRAAKKDRPATAMPKEPELVIG